ncbi:MAG TPA: hypothetical protein VKI44_19595, partial [Acetobacteraceae bacterium]|nr:hypothetical protein [Acetobacteraceae bacterium]
MPDSSPSTPSGRVAFLEWFDALRVADEPPVSNVEAWREAKDNVLPEAVERLRSVRLFIAR